MRGSCQVGNYCVEGAVVRAGGLRCVVAVGRTNVSRVMCRGSCVEGRVSGAVMSGVTTRGGPM